MVKEYCRYSGVKELEVGEPHLKASEKSVSTTAEVKGSVGCSNKGDQCRLQKCFK